MPFDERDRNRCDRCGKFCRWDGETLPVGGITPYEDRHGIGIEPDNVCYRCLGYDLPFDFDDPDFVDQDESDKESAA